MRLAHLVRRPVSEGSVIRNVLVYGTGGLHIDAVRIPSGTEHFRGLFRRTLGGAVQEADSRNEVAQGMFKPGTAFQSTNHPGGRWPSNLILVHGPECQRTGTKKVRGSSGTASGRMAGKPGPVFESSRKDGSSRWLGSPKAGQLIGYTDSDGTETVAAWSCTPECAIAALDAQSGITQSGAMRREVPAYKGESTTQFLRGRSGPSNQHGDSGGASRFFKQVKLTMSESLPQDLIDYLETLITPPGKRAYMIVDTAAESIWADLAKQPNESIAAVIAMGTPTEAQSKELMRVLLPGAHLVLIAPDSEKTGHTGACRLEDEGFEIRDAILLADEAKGLHYVPKASRKEREAGCDHLEGKSGAEATERQEGTAGLNSPRAGAGRTATHVKNHHPTVKPLLLMERLMADIPKGKGAILDPFLGSGSTAVAALRTGHSAIGIEREKEYLEIADARVRFWKAKSFALRHSGVRIESDVTKERPTAKKVDFAAAFGLGDDET